MVSIDTVKLHSELGVPIGGVVVGSVGRLTYQKGFDILIQAFAMLPGTDCFLLIVGEGEEMENLQQLSQDLGVDDRVILTDFRSDIPELLQIIDYYVQPSRWEGMPNTLLEAMASGRPIIASDVDGIRELIQNNEQGWLVPPENPVSLILAIIHVLEHKDEMLKFAHSARKRAENCFSVGKMLDKWEAVLSSEQNE